MNVPSYSALINRDKLIKTVQELCEDDNTSAMALSEIMPDADTLLTNQLSENQEKTIAINSVASLMVTYGYTATTTQNPEYTSVIVDSEDKILMGRKVDGTLEIFGKEYT